MAYGSEVEKLERRWMENPLGVSFAPLAEAYRRAGDPARALEVLGIGLANHPAYVPALIVQARCHLDAGAVPAAEESFRAVLATDAHNIIALKGLADLCEQGGRPEDAVRHLERLLEADPTHDDARHQLERMSALSRERQAASQPAAASEAPAPEAVPPTPEEPAGFEPTSSEIVLAEEEWSTAIDLEVEQSVPLDVLPEPEPALTELGSAPEETPEELPMVETEPAAASDAPVQASADDLGIEKEVGPFDAFEADAWSGERLGLDAAPDAPFEEELTAPWVEATTEWEPRDEVLPASPADLAGEPLPQDAVEPAPEPPPTADLSDVPDALAPVEAEEPATAEAEPSAEADELAEAPAFAVAADEPVATAGEEPEPPQSWVGEEAEAESEPEAEGVVEALAAISEEPAESPAVMEAPVPAVVEPPRPWNEWAAAVVGADPESVPELAPDAPDVATSEVVELPTTSPEDEEPVTMVEGAEAEMPSDEPAAIEPELVITETMAKLFERQGHLTMALAVYAELLERDPLSPGLAEAVQRVRGQLGHGTATPLGDLIAPRMTERGPARESLLDAAPTRPAADHLSLDAVFGASRGASRSGGGMPEAGAPGDEPSFDEFFGEAGVGATGADSAGGADADLEQFNAWLRSLKR